MSTYRPWAELKHPLNESYDFGMTLSITPLHRNMDEPIQVLAGTGGVALGEARTNHQGRKAVLMHRDGDPAELLALAETMGIDVIDIQYQKGKDDPRTYFGKGRLQDVADEISSAVEGHPWHGVDLVIVHSNASPRQLVNIHEAVQVEVWDRVRSVSYTHLTLPTTPYV